MSAPTQFAIALAAIPVLNHCLANDRHAIHELAAVERRHRQTKAYLAQLRAELADTVYANSEVAS